MKANKHKIRYEVGEPWKRNAIQRKIFYSGYLLAKAQRIAKEKDIDKIEMLQKVCANGWSISHGFISARTPKTAK